MAIVNPFSGIRFNLNAISDLSKVISPPYDKVSPEDRKNLWKRDGTHNFCAIHSGAIGFLTGQPEEPQEISIQLWKIHPCCPGTKDPLGDARVEKVSKVLARVSESPVFQRLNEGDPLGMGESVGISREYAQQRTEQLENICLWCDEFFERHYDIKGMAPRTCKGAAAGSNTAS